MIFDFVNSTFEVSEPFAGIDLNKGLDYIFSWSRNSVGESGDVDSFHDEFRALEWRFSHR